MRSIYGIFPFVLLTGFFTAGTNAGMSCNTFPWVGTHWFYSKKHFLADIPLWKNFTENKLVCQVNHRTLGSCLAMLFTYQAWSLLHLRFLSRSARLSIVFVALALWMQISIGVASIWNNMPINYASTHQVGAMTVLTTFIFALHCGRRVDPRHVKNLLGKLRIDDKAAYEQMMKHYAGKQKLTAEDIKMANLSLRQHKQ